MAGFNIKRSDEILKRFLQEKAKKEGYKDLKKAVEELFIIPEFTFEDWEEEKVDWSEIKSRELTYLKLKPLLLDKKLNLKAIQEKLKPSGLVGGHSSIRSQVENFFERESEAKEFIRQLIGDGSQIPDARKIDSFVDKAIKLAFKDKNRKPERHNAILFVSVLLTAVFPEHFVDYRRGRWEAFAEDFELEQFPEEDSPGKALYWAGRVAKQFASLPTFQSYFKTDNPTWWVAGLVYELYKDKDKDKDKEKMKKDISEIKAKLPRQTEEGYSNTGLSNMLNAIETKPFIILSGISGTGKTQIARIISAGVVSSTKKGD